MWEPEPQWPVVVVSTAAIGALTALSAYATGDLAEGLVGLAAVVALPLLGRWPVVGGLVQAVLAALSPVATAAATFTAFNTAQRRPARVAAVVTAAGVAGHAVQGWTHPYPGLTYGWWLLCMLACYAALFGWGTWLRARRQLVCSLVERARRAEAEQGRRVAEARLAERARMAREMHDVLAHRLSLLAVYAGALQYRPDAAPQQLAEAAGVIRTGVHQALQELREVITVLRDDPGGDDSPAGPGLDEVARLVAEAQANGQRVTYTSSVVESPAPVIGRTVYRIVQEALTNARKHAAGAPVTVVVGGGDGRITVDVRNPVPVPAAAGIPGAGVGLVGLTERAGLAGGVLDHAVTAGGEFHVRAELPWRT